jgi:hypothetical protein
MKKRKKCFKRKKKKMSWKILKNRKDINFKLLYCGKINIEDLKRPKFIK